MAFTFGASSTNQGKFQTVQFDSGGSSVLETNVLFFSTELDSEKNVFRCQLTLPGAGLVPMMLAQMRQEVDVFPSIHIQVDIHPSVTDDDHPALIMPSPNATPYRCVEFRNARITEMDSDSVKMGAEVAPGKTLVHTYKMGNTNLWIESTICIQSSPVSRRDLAMSGDFVSHPPFEGLPFYPGVSTVVMATPMGRKQRLIQWNAFAAVPWTPERHWLYPRSLRRIFFTLLLIRRYGSPDSGIAGMDMNIMRKLFQDIAAAMGHLALYPFKLDEASRRAFEKQRQIYVEAIHDPEGPDILEAVCAIPGQCKAIYSPLGPQPPARQGFRFGAQPQVQVQVHHHLQTQQQQQQQPVPLQSSQQSQPFNFHGPAPK